MIWRDDLEEKNITGMAGKLDRFTAFIPNYVAKNRHNTDELEARRIFEITSINSTSARTIDEEIAIFEKRFLENPTIKEAFNKLNETCEKENCKLEILEELSASLRPSQNYGEPRMLHYYVVVTPSEDYEGTPKVSKKEITKYWNEKAKLAKTVFDPIISMFGKTRADFWKP